MWSQSDPVTLFGAAFTKSGWTDIRTVFEWLGSTFSDFTSFSIDVIAAGVSGELGYVAAIERTTASVNGRPPAPYALRVTTIFRHQDGVWKVVHRHGDPLSEDSTNVAALRSDAGRAEG
jgi:ketosteroid isomerase-like protein